MDNKTFSRDHENDTISRQQAIDALTEYGNGRAVFISVGEAVIRIEQLPSAQPTFDARDTQYNLPIGTDCISRQVAIDTILGQPPEPHYPSWYAEQIKELPSAQPKRGRWISADAIFGGVPFYCSECGENTRDTVMGKPRWKFCPNCGADMRGEQDDSV